MITLQINQPSLLVILKAGAHAPAFFLSLKRPVVLNPIGIFVP